MSNHFHLFLRPRSRTCQRECTIRISGCASLFNRRYRRSGSLFQGRFKAIVVENQAHAWELSRYVHLNPVWAKVVPLPQQYRWSSYSVYRFARDVAAAPGWLDWETVLRQYSRDVRNARRAYQRFVEAGIGEPPRWPMKSAVGGLLLGRNSWVEQIRKRLTEQPDDANVPRRKRLAWRPTAADIVGVVQDHVGTGSEDLRQVRRHGNDARVATVYLLRRLTDEKVATLAKLFGGVSVAAISKLLGCAEWRSQEDPRWKNLLEELESKCQKQTPQFKKLKVKT